MKIFGGKIFYSFTMVFVVVFYFFLYLNTYSQNEKNDQMNFRFGYSNVVFQDIDPNDGNAALLIYTRELEKIFYRKNKKNVSLTTKIFYSIDEIRNELNENKIDLLSITSDKFFEIKKEFNLVPCITTISGNDKFTEYIVISSAKKKIKQIGLLKGSTFSIPKNFENSIAEKWLNVVLHTNKLKSSEKFFGKILSVTNEKSAVYNVFFNKTDCAIVRESVFKTLSELNPQIENSLNIVEKSPRFIINVISYKKIWKVRYFL